MTIKFLKSLVCSILGHNYKEKRELYGKLDNGKPIYKQSFGDCERCGKEHKWAT